MTEQKIVTEVRPMTLGDLDAIFAIDHRIRGTGEAITYASLTTERIFTIDRHVGRLAKPISYADLIKGDISGLLELGFVAEVDGHVRGFILGQVSQVGAEANPVGVILILGAHPDYQRKGIATSLVSTLCDKLRTMGIKRVRIDIDRRDKSLVAFFEHIGFGTGHLIDYVKSL